MGVMLLFAVYTSSKSSYGATTTGGLINHRSFWHFETILPLLFFAVIFGMRYNVGVDYLGYLEGYLWREYVGKNDFLFNLLSEIGWKLNLHYAVYFAIIAFIQVFFFFYAFKDERYLFPFLVFFLFTNGEWLNWMNVIRQALAMCIWIFSIRYIEDKKIGKYLFWCIVAFLFHRSAIVLIIFYPILKNGKDYFKSIPLQLILFAGAFVFREIFSEVIMRIEPITTFYSNIIGGELYSSYDIEGLMKSFKEPQGTGLAYLFKIILNVGIILYKHMNIAIVGTGYVGLVSGTCFSELGLNVVCVDVNEKKIENLNKGIIPIYEPGLERMVMRNVAAYRLRFSSSLKEVLNEVDVVFIAVGTPPGEDGSADMRYVLEVAKTIGENINTYKLIVVKSMVPVGTSEHVRSTIQKELDNRKADVEFDVVSNPEFLKEGDALMIS